MPGTGRARPLPPPDDVPLSPEGVVIERARKQIRPALSQRKAARLAGISAAGWTHVIYGWRWDYYGGVKRRASNSGKADTVARMALAVGLAPKALKDIRPDAAAAMILIGAIDNSPTEVTLGPAHIATALRTIQEFCGDQVFNQALALLTPPPPSNAPRKTIPLGR